MRNTIICLLIPFFCLAQKDFYHDRTFTHADSLRGSLRIERTCFDILHYTLAVEVFPDTKSIQGTNNIKIKKLCDSKQIQLDLFRNMEIISIQYENKDLSFTREENAIFIDLPTKLSTIFEIRVAYKGQPREAVRAPWDGGFTWSKDMNNQDWIAVSCQGLGASVWWPCKDHQSDEAESMDLIITTPQNLQIISNGNELSNTIKGGKRTAHWHVSYPINSYNASLNLGDYVHFKESYASKFGGTLPLDYYVLRDNEEKARKHFQQVPGVLEAFEHYFGPYPFYKDGYALIETPYLGMEHQSGIAYGNKYRKGYLGGRLPNNMDWDYIIVHETAHEWFGNKITSADIADIWIHESFTTYAEALYVEYTYDYEQYLGYLKTQRSHKNQEPLVGPFGVNYDGWSDTDHYYKGSWVIHTFRHTLNNDSLFFEILRSFLNTNKSGIVETHDFIELCKNMTQENYQYFFDQYLYYKDIPTFQYSIQKHNDKQQLYYKWSADVPDFHMPIDIWVNDQPFRIEPNTKSVGMVEFEEEDDIELDMTKKLFLLNVKRFNKNDF